MDNKTARQDLETVIRVEDLALGSMRKLRAIQDWLRAEAAPAQDGGETAEVTEANVTIDIPGCKLTLDEAFDETFKQVLSDLEKIILKGQPESGTENASASMPEGFVLMPENLTAENGAKYALSGEFHEVVELECTACDADDEDCEVCSGNGSYTYRVPVSWTTIKEIYTMAVSKLAVATSYQPPPSVPIPILSDLRFAVDSLESGFTICEACGHQTDFEDQPLDCLEWVRGAWEYLDRQHKLESAKRIVANWPQWKQDFAKQAFGFEGGEQRALSGDSVPVPENKDQARAMALSGWAWLRDNQPEELTELYPNTLAPDGWKLVPAQPTASMCEGGACVPLRDKQSEASWIAEIYRAMLDAAPNPPAKGAE